MRVALLAAASVALAVAATACGSRHGGSPAPRLRFSISDGTLPFGGCASMNQPDLISPVGAASRGHCLFFDVRGTLDHDGNAALFQYTFSWVTTGGDIVLAQSTAELVAVISEAERVLPIGQPSTFRVDARKVGSGERGSKSVFFTALNLAPIADAGEARVLPVHGYPWVNFPQVALRFDASKSRDPDGDPLVYCWRFSQAGIPVCGTDPHDPEFVGLVSVANEGRYFARIDVTDGIDTSLPEGAEVDVRTAGSWAVGAGTFIQVDPARTVVAVAGSAVALAIVPGSPEALVVASAAAAGGSASLSIAPLPLAAPRSPAVASALASPSLFADPANARVWALGQNAQTIAEAYPVTVSSTPSIAAPTTVIVDPALDATRSAPVGAVVGASLWVGVGDTLVKVDADGAIGVLRREPGLVFRAIAPRPGYDEVWVLVAPDPAGGPAPGQVALEVLDTAGTPHDFLQASELVDGLVFVGANELVARLSDGLVDLDPASLLATQTFDAARWRAPIGALSALVYDAGAGLFWGNGVDPASGIPVVWRVRRDGTRAAFEGGTLPAVVEPTTGALWFGGRTLMRSYTPQLSSGAGQGGTYPSPGPATDAQAGQDERTGGLWTIAQSPVTGLDELLHVSADGTRVESITRALVNGTNESLPNLVALRVEPGGAAIWGFDRAPQSGAMSLRRYDLATDPPTAITLLDAAQLAPRSPYTPIVEPSSPMSGMPIFAWLVRVSSAPWEVEQLTLNGTISAAWPIPSNERDPVDPTRVDARAALGRADQSLCIATAQSNALLHVRRIDADGTPNALGTIALDPTDKDPWSHFRVATSWAPGKSLCWAGTRTGATSFEIDAWDRLANVHSLVRTGATLVDLDPVTNDDVRVVYVDAATGARRMEQVVFPAGAGPVVPWPAAWQLVHQHQSH